MPPQLPPLGTGTCASLPLPQRSVSSAIFLPPSPISPQTLFDFSSRNYVSAKQSSEASGASTTAPVSAKLNQHPQKTAFQQGLHMTTSAITVYFPTNKWGATIQEEVKTIFFPLFRSWSGWRSIQTPQTLRKPQCSHLPWTLKLQLLVLAFWTLCSMSPPHAGVKTGHVNYLSIMCSQSQLHLEYCKLSFKQIHPIQLFWSVGVLLKQSKKGEGKNQARKGTSGIMSMPGAL